MLKNVASMDIDRCDICMKPYDNIKRYPLVLPCSHRICRECYLALEKPVCPCDTLAFDIEAVKVDVTSLRCRVRGPGDTYGAGRVSNLLRSWESHAPTHFTGINPLERYFRSNGHTLPPIKLVEVLTELGNTYSSISCYLEARDLFERAHTVAEKQYGTEHANVGRTLMNLGNVCADLQDLATAREHFERALPIKERQFGPHHPEVASALVNLGNVCAQLGDVGMAEELCQRALGIKDRRWGPGHPDLPEEVATKEEKIKKKKLLKTAVVDKERQFGPHHPEVAAILVNLGSVCGDLGDKPRARVLLERALIIIEKHFGPDHPQVADTLVNLGNLYNGKGGGANAVRSKELIERARIIKEKYSFNLRKKPTALNTAL